MTRLPAIPLIAADPYFSVWMPADKLTDADSNHWCGISQPIYGTLYVDGKPFRFLGTGSAPALPTKDLTVTPCTTTAVYENEQLCFTVSFTNPFLPEDLDRVSMPVCLVKADVKVLDGAPHDVKLVLELSDRMCWTGEKKPALRYMQLDQAGLNISALGQMNQKLLCHSADHITIDWGYLYAACADAKLSNEGGALKLEKQLGADSARIMLAYDDVASILYFGHPCKAWYARKGLTIIDALKATAEQFDTLLEKCAALDEKLLKEAHDIGGDDYSLIVSAAWRHVFAAHKLICDDNGEMVFLSKENDSNGCIGTVDVSYPSTPLFLKFCPELVNAMCRPVLRFAHTNVWKYDFAPHDVGQYPIVNGQVYGAKEPGESRRIYALYPPYYLFPADPEIYRFESQMPVEESGNMLIMMYAAAFFGASEKLMKDNRDLCDKWVKYLLEYGEDPAEQLCTDDFAGHLNHNINLAAKAIVGVACYARILAMNGEDGSFYAAKAKEMAKSWYERAYSPEGTYLTFDKKGWSMKYNLVWDKVFDLGLFGDEFYDWETRSYLKRMNTYGLPLDNRATYTKSDWILWTSAMARDPEVRKAIIAPVAKYLRESKTRVAFSDWYFTDTGSYRAFIARSVQGGLFMPFICK